MVLVAVVMGGSLASPATAEAKRKADKNAAAAAPQADIMEPVVPEGFQQMTVLGVVPSDGGGTVMLTDTAETVVMPIGVGPSEALSIHLRLERRRYERPLTHDLMDVMMRELGGTLVQVRIDDLRSQVYVATLYIEQDDKTVKMDSRASDAIALALGAQIPIYFADTVVEAGSIPWEEFLEPVEEAPAPGAPDNGPEDGEEKPTPRPTDPETTAA